MTLGIGLGPRRTLIRCRLSGRHAHYSRHGQSHRICQLGVAVTHFCKRMVVVDMQLNASGYR